jgi:hypothetical protein
MGVVGWVNTDAVRHPTDQLRFFRNLSACSGHQRVEFDEELILKPIHEDNVLKLHS